MSDNNALFSDQRGRGWGGFVMKWLAASPVAWLSLGVSIIVPTTAVVYNYARLASEVGAVQFQVTRNREESTDKYKSLENQVSNLFTSMNAIYGMRTDVEVIKTQIQSINDAVRRIESAQRRSHHKNP